MSSEHGTKKRSPHAAGPVARDPDLPAYAKQFVTMIQDLSQVKQVTFEPAIPELCTVIEAAWPDDTARDPIYEAQGNLLRANPGVEVDFRVVNRSRNHTRDYPGVPPAGLNILLRRS